MALRWTMARHLHPPANFVIEWICQAVCSDRPAAGKHRLAPRQSTSTLTFGGNAMLGWALLFLVVALIAAVLGFGGIAAGATWIAKILFFVFLILFIVSLVAGGFRRPAAKP